MWSAPRSLSTVLLYAFAQHPDCFYFDEPFLWSYLKRNQNFELEGIEPYLQSELADAEKQYAALFADHGKPVHYIKNMAYQCDDPDAIRLDCFTHGFLIRSPEKIVASYLKNCSECSGGDFALNKLWRIYQRVKAQGEPAPVIDADDLLKNPELMLKALCRIFAIPFTPAMLRWEPGPLKGNITLPGTWYDEVKKSTGFRNHTTQHKTMKIDSRHQLIVDQMLPFYEKLYPQRLTIEKAEQITLEPYNPVI